VKFSFRPKSILRLILAGFLFVALPLIVALMIATFSVDRLVTHSQHALLQSVLVTQGSQVLVEAITAMERNARQYQVLGDKLLFDVYQENHERFVDTARTLKSLELTGWQEKLLGDLQLHENEIYTVLSTYAHDARETLEALTGFSGLASTAQQILVQNQDLISSGVEQIQARAEKVQRTLVMQAVALVPAALLLTGLFAVLITRPINQIDDAIRRLGDGKFSKPAIVTGPRDLEQLGERLNWLRHRLLELEQEKTKFLQHISHELKTPLTAIREGAELMGEQVVGGLNSQQREIAEILRDNSIQLQKLIEDLLNFSMVKSRTSTLFHEMLNMQVLVEDVLNHHKVAMLSRKLDLRKSLQPVILYGDREKLHTLVDNLVSNAVKYSPDGAALWVRLFQRESQCIIEVADSGPGIPASERERVFDAFYQGAPADKSHVRGTGLGLSIAREYAQAHGGNVAVVKSRTPGACLQVRLPVEQDT
jgi:two-component system, NtrC family, sensor histidine kinase GlrK